MGLYPSIPHEAGFKSLRKVLDKSEKHTAPTSELLRMADFVRKINYFEFNGQIKQHTSGTKFNPPYTWLYKSETAFLETQEL